MDFWKRNKEKEPAQQAPGEVEAFLLAYDNSLVDALNKARGRPVEALIVLEKMTKLKPDIAEVWGLKGATLAELQFHEEALRSFNVAVSLDPNFPLAWQGKGACLVHLNRYEEALAALERARSTDLVWDYRGTALASLGRYDESVEAFEEAIRLNTGNQEVLAHSRSSLGEVKRRQEAVKANEKRPEHEKAFRKMEAE